MKNRAITFVKYLGLFALVLLATLVVIGLLVPSDRIEDQIALVDSATLRDDGVLELEVRAEGEHTYEEFQNAMGAVGMTVYVLRERQQEVAGIEGRVYRQGELALVVTLDPEGMAAFPQKKIYKNGYYGYRVMRNGRIVEIREEGENLLHRFCKFKKADGVWGDFCIPYR